MNVTNLVRRTYNPTGYDASSTVLITQEQADALDAIEKKSEFAAYFWSEKVEWFNNGDMTLDGQRVIRINGQHNVLAPEDSTSQFRGMGGRKVVLTLTNGDVVVSTNLWHQGEIPRELRDILVDNAKWGCN